MTEIVCTDFNNSISSFLSFKRALGYDYRINETHLNNLKQFILNQYPDATTLDEKIVLGWSQRRANESPASMLRRASTIRELARYLISLGKDAYVLPKTCTPKAIRFSPHAFSRGEIKAFFTALDNDFQETKSDPTRHLDAQAAFRIMYCCALRPGEVVGLERNDVDLNYGNLFIRKAKGRKDRIVPFDEGLKDYLLHYDGVAGVRLSFIAGRNDGFRKPAEIGSWFREIWDELCSFGITQGNRARAYNFRHHHPTRRIALWMKEGVDVATKQVFLMNYMGHCGFKETDYYIHLTQDMHDQLLYIMDDIGSRYWIKEQRSHDG
jgi:integrase/recombinase XerD